MPADETRLEPEVVLEIDAEADSDDTAEESLVRSGQSLKSSKRMCMHSGHLGIA